MAPRNKSSITSTDDSGDDSMKTGSDEGRSQKRSSAGHRSKKHFMDKSSDEYRKWRERNNLAVKKSRTKSKMKTQETLERVNQLRAENEMLESKIKLLTKELSFLKDLFLAHAGSAHGQHLTDVDLSILDEEDDSERVRVKREANSQAIENDHKYTSSQDSDASA